MKKLLTILGALGLTATAGLSVVACANNSDYNAIKDFVNSTKGTFDENGIATKQSSTTVVYIGAKDNASSMSFDKALSSTLGADAKHGVEKAKDIFNTSLYSSSFVTSGSKQIIGSSTAATIDGVTLAPGQVVSIANQYNVTVNTDGTFALDANWGLKLNTNYNIRVYTKTVNTYSNEFQNAWSTSTLNMFNNANIVHDKQAKVETDTDSDYYGKQRGSENYNLYGSLGDTNSFVNVAPSINFKSIMLDSISDEWTSDSFNKFFDDYLYDDLMVQRATVIKGEAANSYADAVKTAMKAITGPIFMVFTNGHLVGMLNGWNRYKEFGGSTIVDSTKNQYKNDVKAWIASLTEMLSSSLDLSSGFAAVDGSSAIAKITGTWNTSDDTGASNWDYDDWKTTDGSSTTGGDDSSSSDTYSYNIKKYA